MGVFLVLRVYDPLHIRPCFNSDSSNLEHKLPYLVLEAIHADFVPTTRDSHNPQEEADRHYRVQPTHVPIVSRPRIPSFPEKALRFNKFDSVVVSRPLRNIQTILLTFLFVRYVQS